MYYAYIETDRAAKKSHDDAQRKVAGDRALHRLDYNKKHAKKEQTNG